MSHDFRQLLTKNIKAFCYKNSEEKEKVKMVELKDHKQETKMKTESVSKKPACTYFILHCGIDACN